MHGNIDLDTFCYTASFAGEKRYNQIRNKETGEVLRFGKGKGNYVKDIKDVYNMEEWEFIDKHIEVEELWKITHTVDIMIKKMFRECTFESVTYFISPLDKSNWRNEYATELPYKGNRKSEDKPKLFDQVKEYLIKEYGPIICWGFEADDFVSYAQTPSTVLVDNDKDTDMVPGWHYNPRKKEKYYVTEAQGKYNFYSQLLTGDASDNIGGCLQSKEGRKFGPATAQVFLLGERVPDKDIEFEMIEQLDFDHIEERITKHYIEIYGKEGLQLMVERGNLLWMPRPGKEVFIPNYRGFEYRLPIKESLDVLLR